MKGCSTIQHYTGSNGKVARRSVARFNITEAEQLTAEDLAILKRKQEIRNSQ